MPNFTIRSRASGASILSIYWHAALSEGAAMGMPIASEAYFCRIADNKPGSMIYREMRCLGIIRPT